MQFTVCVYIQAGRTNLGPKFQVYPTPVDLELAGEDVPTVASSHCAASSNARARSSAHAGVSREQENAARALCGLPTTTAGVGREAQCMEHERGRRKTGAPGLRRYAGRCFGGNEWTWSVSVTVWIITDH